MPCIILAFGHSKFLCPFTPHFQQNPWKGTPLPNHFIPTGALFTEGTPFTPKLGAPPPFTPGNPFPGKPPTGGLLY
eukprot:1500584-Karenia_brevis.AAC.1